MNSKQESINLVRRRFLAFLIDYCVILVYTALLIAISLSVIHLSGGSFSAVHPLRGQLVGFITLTIPVFLYFYLSERGRNCATIGKRKMGIRVANEKSGGVFWRNALKFLPWEMAHTGVHWIVYTGSLEQETPIWVFVVLIFPQVVVLAYFVSIFWTRGKSSVYDKLAGTSISSDLKAETSTV